MFVLRVQNYFLDYLCSDRKFLYLKFLNYSMFTITNCVYRDNFFRMHPWKLSVRFDRYVSKNVWSEYEIVCNDRVSASDNDSAAMISTVILSAVATNQGLQQNISEDGLRTQEHRKRATRRREHRWTTNGRSHTKGASTTASNER